MATASSTKAEVGTIKVATGDVKVIGVDGVARTVGEGDKVYAKEIIQTAANAVVQVQLADGRMLDLGRESQITLDDDLLGSTQAATSVPAAPTEDIAALQAAIAAGADPSKIAEATAAGGAPGAGGAGDEGSHDAVIIDQANSTGPVTSGFQTVGAAIGFPGTAPYNQLPVAPTVSVNVQVELQVQIQAPPPPAGGAGDVPFARNDTDVIPKGTTVATGNVVTGGGTTSGATGADTLGSDGATVTAISGTPVSNNNGVITVAGEFGVLTINPDGSYVYTRNPGSPDGVVDTFTYTLTDGSGDKSTANLLIDIGGNGDGTPQLPGDPDGNGVVISGNSATLIEGTGGPDKIVNFVLSLDHPYILDVQVTYTIVPGTAQNPSDFGGALTGTVTIPVGETKFIVPVTIVPDHFVEGDEGFKIVLSNAVNAFINPNANAAFVTIVNDDLPPLARDDSYDVVRGQPNSLTSVLTHKDPGEVTDDSGAGPGETLTVTTTGTIITAQGGTVVMQSDGTFVYTPPQSLHGTDTFAYSMTDGYNGISSATVRLIAPNEPPSVRFDLAPGEGVTNEAGLAIGSNPASTSEFTHGKFVVSDPNGLSDILSVTINGLAIPMNNLTGSVITTPVGVMTINAYDTSTGIASFTYELKTPVTDVPNQLETDVFTVTVTDNASDTSAPARLAIDIIDDLPVARDDTDTVASGSFVPETGNVLTGEGTAGGVAGSGADTKGADGAVLTGISVLAGGAVPQNADGSFTVSGQYGVLAINPNGSYSYARSLGTPGGVQDKFTYTLTDGDGDTSSANLTINIGNAPVELFLKDARVFEAGLPVIGSHAGDGSNITTGAVTFNAKDGLQGVTLDGTLITGVPNQQIVHSNGTLTVNALNYDVTTGNGTLTYSYKLTQPTSGDTTFDNFAVLVTDKGGGTSNGVLNISIVDDVPTARSDADAVNAGSFVETGNVVTGAGTVGGLAGTGADTKGADSATVTAVTGPNGASQPGPNGTLVIHGLYGDLSIQPNGDYTYTRNPGTPGGVSETFRYTLTDTDGDASAANLVISIGDAQVTLALPDTQVNEAGLPTGSHAGDGSNSTIGSVTFNAKDGLQGVTMDGVTINPPVAGQPPQIITGPGHDGALAVTGLTYDPVTGNGSLSYSYTLTKNTAGDTTSDSFTVVVTDANNSNSSGALTIDIVDDVPTARNDFDTVASGSFGPETGNVITAVGTVGTPGPDTPGADNATLVNIASNNVPGNAATNAAGVLTINGQYGVLTIHPDGGYSYTRTPGTPGGVTDTFRYTLRDGDGDTSAANLAINIASADKPVTDVPSTLVNEAGLSPAGSNAGDGSNTVASTFSFKSVDGLSALTLDGVAIHAPVAGSPQIITGVFGALTVTGFAYNSVTGNGFVNYSYTLATNTSGDTASDNFAVVVSDKDGNNSAGTLKVGIIDDVPTAHADTGAINSGGTITTTSATGVELNDKFGADGKDVSGGVVGVKAGNDTANPVLIGVGAQIVGALGTLTLNADGSYTYKATPNVNSGADTFVYSIKDGDGDLSTTTLTINVNKVGPQTAVGSVTVDEALLPGIGTHSTGAPDIGNGTLSLPSGVTVVTGAQQDQTGAHGTLHVNQDGTFSYTLTSPLNSGAVQGPNTVNGVEAFSVTTTDVAGNTNTATITVNVKDDVPTVTVGAVGDGSITLTTQDAQTIGAAFDTDSASFAAAFQAAVTPIYGADGAGSTVVNGYNLTVSNATSGLSSDGQPITLAKVGNDVVGSTTAGEIFRISVDSTTGVVTLKQSAELDHVGAGNDTQIALANGKVLLGATATVTDSDGDIAAQSVSADLGGNIRFDDDIPTVTVGVVGDGSITLTTYDALTIGPAFSTDTASFATVFMAAVTPNYGADGAGSTVVNGYNLTVSNAASGLSSEGQPITLAKVGNDVVGSTTAGEIFRISVDSATGVVTLKQSAQLDHGTGATDAQIALADGKVLLGATATVTDGDGDTAAKLVSADLGGNINFYDDGPIVTVTTTNEAGSTLTTHDALTIGAAFDTASSTANFGGVFGNVPVYGADGAALSGQISMAYTLGITGTPVAGLVDSGLTIGGTHINLYSVGGIVVGSTATTAPATATDSSVVFSVGVASATGVVTLTQYQQLDHAAPGSAAAPYDTQLDTLANGLVSLTGTATAKDFDGDTATNSATIDLGGGNIQFADAGPSVTVTTTNEAGSTLTTHDALTIGAAFDTASSTANFGGVFGNVPVYGADGAALSGQISMAYKLDITGTPVAGLVDSGLTIGGTHINLYSVGGIVVGSTATTAPATATDSSVVFSVGVASATGVVTLTQYQQLDHAAPGSAAAPYDTQLDTLANGLVSLTGTATAKDFDGDTATNSATIDLGGGNIQFADAGPSVTVTTTNEAGSTLTTHDALTIGAAFDTASSTANFGGVFGNVPVYGADGAALSGQISMAYKLDITGTPVAGLVDSGLTIGGTHINLYSVGGIVVGSTATTAPATATDSSVVFSVGVASATGVVTLTQYQQLDHAAPGSAAAPYDTQLDTLANGLVSLTGTATAKDFDGDTATNSATIDLGGGNIQFADAGPSVTVTTTNEAGSTLTTHDALTIGAAFDTASSTANFGGVFGNVPVYGADGAALSGQISMAYKLDITGTPVAGLVDSGLTIGGTHINLYSVGGIVVGSTATTAPATATDSSVVFSVGVASATGVVTLTQYQQLDHAAPGSAAAPYDTQLDTLANGLVSLTGTATAKDFDGDTATNSATIDLGGGNIQFADAGPSVTVTTTNEAGSTLTTHDALTIGAAFDTASSTANFGGVFGNVPVYGADGAALSGQISMAYKLDITGTPVAGLVDSGLTIGGTHINLYSVGGIVVGSTATTAPATATDSSVVFSVGVASATGVVTLTQYQQLDHAAPGSAAAPYDTQLDTLANGLVSLTGTATAKDFDGDTATNSATIDLGGGNIQFADAGPTVSVTVTNESNTAVLTHDALTVGAASDTATTTANFGGVLTINSAYGADGAGTSNTTYTLSLDPAVLPGVDSGLTIGGAHIHLYNVGGVIVGSTATTAPASPTDASTVFSIGVNSTGAVMLTQYQQLDHGAPLSATDTLLKLADHMARLTATVTTTDFDGDTATASNFVDLGGNIQFADATPTAALHVNTGQAQTSDTNLMIILDVSGSMADHIFVNQTAANPTGVDSGLTRLDFAKASVIELMEQYESLGNVKVELVTFTSTASNTSGQWVDIATAKAELMNLTPQSRTNYDDALNTAVNAFGTAGKIAGAQNVSYFLSDGVPNDNGVFGTPNNGFGTPNTPGIVGSEITAWTNFVNSHEINSFALGMGSGATQATLDPIAYNGIGAGTETNALVVTDVTQLAAQLVATVHSSVTGNLVSNDGGGFGADGGHVQSIHVGTTTYNYDGTKVGTGAGTYDGTHGWTVTTAQGGVINAHLDTGAYSYNGPTSISGVFTDAMTYTLIDNDGDTASNGLTIQIDPANAPTVVRDVLVISNQTNVVIPDWALLSYDTAAGAQSITAVGTPATSDSVTHNAAVTTYGDANNNGGSFIYTDSAGTVHPDSHVNLSHVTGSTIAGVNNAGTAANQAYLNQILVGGTANETITGGAANDVLLGGGGNDSLNGGIGNDILVGGAGNDTLTGGLGHDTFRFESTAAANGIDTITDFSIGDATSNTSANANADVLNISQLLQGSGISATAFEANAGAYLSFARVGTTTTVNVLFDADGAAGNAPVQIATLQNIPTSVSVSTLLTTLLTNHEVKDV